MTREQEIWTIGLVASAAIYVATAAYNHHVKNAMESRTTENNTLVDCVRQRINAVGGDNKFTDSDVNIIHRVIDEHDKLCDKAKIAGII